MTKNLPPDFFQTTSPSVAGQMCVIAQLGQSLDGRIATLSGESRGISGAAALDHLHRLRAQADVVLVGVGTVEADDPSLTVRRVAGRHPLRVIVDPTGRVSRHARCLTHLDGGCLVITSAEVDWPAGVEVLRLPCVQGAIAPGAIVNSLASRGVKRLLVEGGATTVSRFMDAGCIDRLHLMIAPVIIGAGRNGLDLRAEAALGKALRPVVSVHDLGAGDVLYVCDLRSAFMQRDMAQPEALVYKIAPALLWQRAEEIGRFSGAPVDVADGFIHFSSGSQVAETAARHFTGQDGLLLIAVHTEPLGQALKWEPSRGGALFPHLYGDLPLTAVASVTPLMRQANGDFNLAGLLA